MALCDRCKDSPVEMKCYDYNGDRLHLCWKCYYTMNPRWVCAKGTPGDTDYIRAHWECDLLPEVAKVHRQKHKFTVMALPKDERTIKRYCYCRKEGYVRVPYGDIDIMRYRLVAQWKLGRSLRKGEQVHHINGIKHDDRPSNLRIVTWKEHREIHNHIGEG